MAHSNRTIGSFHKGDRVVLIPNNFHPEPGYPVYGSNYSDVGTVVEIDRRHESIGVRWDQGTHTHFSPGYIDLHDDYIAMLSKPDPNRSFKDRKYNRTREVRRPKQVPPVVMADGKVTLSYADWRKSQIDR